MTARAISPALSEHLGQRLVIDNRPGAAGDVGTELVAKAQPDGHTLLVGNISTIAINPTAYASLLTFDIASELAPVTLQSRGFQTCSCPVSDYPPNALRELIDYAKTQPGQLNYSNPVGGISHLDMLEFMSKAGISMVNIPSKGGGSSAPAIITGEIHCSMISAATVVPQVKGGRMKAFVVTAQRRLSDLPGCPTLAEAGFPGVGSEFWVGFFVVPAKTPHQIVRRLHAAVLEVTQQPVVNQIFEKAQLPLAVSASPDEFRAS